MRKKMVFILILVLISSTALHAQLRNRLKIGTFDQGTEVYVYPDGDIAFQPRGSLIYLLQSDQAALLEDILKAGNELITIETYYLLLDTASNPFIFEYSVLDDFKTKKISDDYPDQTVKVSNIYQTTIYAKNAVQTQGEMIVQFSKSEVQEIDEKEVETLLNKYELELSSTNISELIAILEKRLDISAALSSQRETFQFDKGLYDRAKEIQRKEMDEMMEEFHTF